MSLNRLPETQISLVWHRHIYPYIMQTPKARISCMTNQTYWIASEACRQNRGSLSFNSFMRKETHVFPFSMILALTWGFPSFLADGCASQTSEFRWFGCFNVSYQTRSCTFIKGLQRFPLPQTYFRSEWKHTWAQCRKNKHSNPSKFFTTWHWFLLLIYMYTVQPPESAYCCCCCRQD